MKSSLTRLLARLKPPSGSETSCGRTAATGLALAALTATQIHRNESIATHCDNSSNLDLERGHSENDRFLQCWSYHRHLLPDYQRRWPQETKNHSWPRRVPQAEQLPSLELDLRYCLQSNNDCLDHKFRIATYYIHVPALQRQGYRLVKELAEAGHPDGMCLYGIILQKGMGVDPDPNQAVVWWRRCVDYHKHVTAMYELGVALYVGEGVPENVDQAVRWFARAANLGHAGAAYMLGECLLDGVGVERDRADALEWLVTAGELGHELARKRVIKVLNQEFEELPEKEWSAAVVNIERRYTIGGGSRNPVVLQTRQTKVKESRTTHVDDDENENDDNDNEDASV